MRLGLFGGRFDPPHIGHLLAAQGALEALDLGELWFVPAQTPPHKPAAASPQHRLQMLRLATEGNPHFRVSDLELERPGPSYTFDTVAGVRAQDPERELFFITGLDAYAEIANWHRARELVEAVNMVAVARPGYNLEALAPFFRQRVQVLPARLCDVSSTEIRTRLASNRTVRYLVPDPVGVYLDEHALYRE